MSWMWMSIAAAEPLVAVVLVDREARDEGYAIQIDGWLVEDALPVDVARGEVLELVDPDGHTERMQVAAGEAWEVTGPNGETWMALLDDEIRTDLLVVRGDRQAIDDLADALDARVTEKDGALYLEGKDIVLDAGWADAELALKIEAVSFVKVRARQDDAPRQPRAPLSARAPMAAAPAPEPVSEAKPTGVIPSVAAVAPSPPTAEVEPAAPVASEVQAFPSDAVLDQLRRYSGIHVCGGRVLVNMRPDGTWAFDGQRGYWHVSAPGMIRFQTFEGQLLYKAGFDENLHCRAVWAPDSHDSGAGLQHGEKPPRRNR